MNGGKLPVIGSLYFKMVRCEMGRFARNLQNGLKKKCSVRTRD